MAAIEALLSAQAIDLLGDKPQGVTQVAYDRVRALSAIYLKDRPLSKEIEALHREFASEGLLHTLVEMAPMPEFDDFFALGK
jgi:histidine ammonia-lyase